jgi:NADH dehydrogenase (ubiquinone) Fe-S protein 4
MQATEDQASLIVSEMSPATGPDQIGVYHPEHQPDYNATVDHATSSYSPIPKRVMDGSEPGETLAAAVLSGAPIDLQARQVRYVISCAWRKPHS